jgi:hypothetical protein
MNVDRRHKMGSNDWSSICPRVVNDVHGHLSASAAYSQYRDERHGQDDVGLQFFLFYERIIF